MSPKQPGAGHAPPPPGADDFTPIKGVGPVHAQQLYAAGITTFAQLGSLSAEEIAAQLGGAPARHAARIRAEQWAEQARALAEQKAGGPVVDPSPGSLGEGGHDEATAAEPAHAGKGASPIIVITLTLNPDTSVAETMLRYPVPERGFRNVSWPGWNERRLLRQLARHANLTGSDDVAEAAQAEPVSDEQGAATAPAIARAQEPEPCPRLRRLELVREADGAPQRFMAAHDPERYKVMLDLDMADLLTADAWPRHYQATVYGRPLAGGPRRRIAQGSGPIPIEGGPGPLSYQPLPPHGLYRLEADLELDAPDKAPFHRAVTLEGGLVYVF